MGNKTHAFTLLVLVSSASLASLSYAQEGHADFPSISAEAGHIYIKNRTNQEVVFYLESEHTERTEHHLGPGMGATFSGDASDQWFNIQVYSGTESNKHESSYGLDAGSRHYIAWENGVLDVFRIPPK